MALLAEASHAPGLPRRSIVLHIMRMAIDALPRVTA